MMCEECWRDASRDALLMGETTVDRYHELVKERQSDPEHVARNSPPPTPPEVTAFVHGDDDAQPDLEKLDPARQSGRFPFINDLCSLCGAEMSGQESQLHNNRIIMGCNACGYGQKKR